MASRYHFLPSVSRGTEVYLPLCSGFRVYGVSFSIPSPWACVCLQTWSWFFVGSIWLGLVLLSSSCFVPFDWSIQPVYLQSCHWAVRTDQCHRALFPLFLFTGLVCLCEFEIFCGDIPCFLFVTFVHLLQFLLCGSQEAPIHHRMGKTGHFLADATLIRYKSFTFHSSL